MSNSQSRWDALLRWLHDHGMEQNELCVERRPRPSFAGAGHGLFATKLCPPSTPLFTVPARALMNARTIGPHYSVPKSSSSPLTATQLLSLHLLLHRPLNDQESLDPLFGPYISILPREFDSHPLTWLVKQEFAGTTKSLESKLLEYLSPSVMVALVKLAARFWADWKTLCDHVQNHPKVTQGSQQGLSAATFRCSNFALTMDFVWAWLNVNTRCIYHRLNQSRSDPNNLTLCPILDFANHSQTLPCMLPAPSHADIWNISPRHIGDVFTLLSPPNVTVNPGEELYLQYGAHANSTLFVEYGFVNEITAQTPEEGSLNLEVDVQDILQDLFTERGSTGQLMKDVLESEGYWGDWTMHSSPGPAYPSYRLITALRLYHIPMEESTEPERDDLLQSWRDTFLGRREYVSERNESAWRNTLIDICRTLMERATSRMTASDAEVERVIDSETWGSWSQGNIRMLWEEELFVAKAVMQSVQNGEQF